MEDSNSRFGAAIRRGLERFWYESHLCGESAAYRTAQPIHEMKATDGGVAFRGLLALSTRRSRPPRCRCAHFSYGTRLRQRRGAR